MPFNFFTYMIYSPRGTSENAILSRQLVGRFKNGDSLLSNRIAEKLINDELLDFFHNSVLVPTPRSSPLVQGGFLPTEVLVDSLVSQNIGSSKVNILHRVHSVPKSSQAYTSESRPSVDIHFNSLTVDNILITEPNIILVDDVLTLGRTTFASASRIQEVYPDKTVKIFAAFRTRSFENTEILVSPQYGVMNRANNGGVQLPD